MLTWKKSEFRYEGSSSLDRTVFWKNIKGWKLSIHFIDARKCDARGWHCHMKDQWSLTIWGSATELTSDEPGIVKSRWLFPGRFVRRNALQKHVILDGFIVTLILTNPNYREGMVYDGHPDAEPAFPVIETKSVKN